MFTNTVAIWFTANFLALVFAAKRPPKSRPQIHGNETTDTPHITKHFPFLELTKYFGFFVTTVTGYMRTIL